jgi:hypothetical protein
MAQNEPTINSGPPDFTVPEVKRTKEWYLSAGRYFCGYFNQPFFTFGNFSGAANNYSRYPIAEIIDNWAFFLGKQGIGVNNAMVSESPAAVMYRPGQELYTIINNKAGKLSEFFSNTSVATELLSKEAKSRKQIRMEFISLVLNQQMIFSQLQEMGINFNAIPPGVQGSTKEEIMRRSEETLKEVGQIVAEETMYEQWNRLNLENMYKNWGLQLLVAGLGGVDNYVFNGKLEKKLIEGHQIIWDNAVNDELNRAGRFRGYVTYWVSPDDIISMYGPQMTKEEYEEILSYKRSMPPVLSAYNTVLVNNSPLWYQAGGTTSNPFVTGMSVVKMYFKGPRDLRYRIGEGGGLQKITDIGKDGKPVEKNLAMPGDRIEEIWYQCVIVGNKYVFDYGPCFNQAYDPIDPQEPICPMTLVIPGMAMNQYVSDVGRIKAIQRKLDYYENKIDELVSQDYGKNYFINMSKLGIVDPQEVFKDFRSQRISFRSFNGEADDQVREAITESVDLSLDPNVRFYVELRQVYNQIMKENASTPDVALGTNPAYIGKGVQQNTLAAASVGLNSFFRTFLLACQRDMQTGVNMQKLAFYAEENDDAIMDIIGLRGYNFVKVTPDYFYERLGVYLKFEDSISAQEKQELKTALMGAVQRGEITFREYVNAITFKSYTDMKNYFDALYEIKAMEQQAQMEAQQTAQMEQAAIAAETAKYKADTQAAAQQYSSDNRRQAQEYNSEVGLEKEKIRTQKDIVLADEKAAQQG